MTSSGFARAVAAVGPVAAGLCVACATAWAHWSADLGPGPLGATTYPIVDTGQDRCYDAARPIGCPQAGRAFGGQDAQNAGRQPSYTIAPDGLTVHDDVTGLTWQRSPDTDGDRQLTARDKLTWTRVASRPAALNASGLGGFTDWRLPTIKELYSLIDFRGTDPSAQGTDTAGLRPFIDADVFGFAYGDTRAGERVIDSQYASSTLYEADSGMLFGVNFADGRIKGYGLRMPGGAEKTFFVICVRGAASYGANRFAETGTGTIVDAATGLEWAMYDSGSGMDWEAALAWAQARNAERYLGHGDWRLPDAKELHSIVDYARSPGTTGSAAIDPAFDAASITNEAGQKDAPAYWTSTTHARADGSGAAAVYISFGRAMGYMNGAWRDVHGAGAQRSDPKSGDPAEFPRGRGPQGDAVRILNHVRLVRTAGETTSATPSASAPAPTATADAARTPEPTGTPVAATPTPEPTTQTPETTTATPTRVAPPPARSVFLPRAIVNQ